MLTVHWYKYQDNWCPLEGMNFSKVMTSGVYVIWYAGNPGRYVRVGSGRICDRLSVHKNDAEILSYARAGKLYVTWAAVPGQWEHGVERFLADTLKPLVGDRFPVVAPVPVNLPHAA